MGMAISHQRLRLISDLLWVVLGCVGFCWSNDGSVEQPTRFTVSGSETYQQTGYKKENLLMQFRQHSLSILGEMDK